ncbi:unnamed protein product [Mycena citricolor]|uniref:Uncharacterized protein n=1 Tax=Mycena citricolor TaxID=2018698 RepID=A0AAD2GVZ7_9AGAR|nr:unnamed protein product [Mycena citricolor]
MSDDEMGPEPSRPPLFFASSDEEEDTEDVAPESEARTAPETSSPSSRASSPPIIIVDSDEETKVESHIPQKRAAHTDEVVDDPKSPLKARPDQEAPSADPARTSVPPAAKKRRVSPEAPPTPDSSPTYIGEMVFGHAWSNVSGTGYIKVNDPVQILRGSPHGQKKTEDKKALGTAKTKKSGDGKKQMSLTAMLKQPAKSSSKKKPDTIVRLYNSRGFEFGRLPQDVSSWIAKLLDFGIVEFRGKMTDCPNKLTVGANLIVSADVYMLPTAFKPFGQETAQETATDKTFLMSEGTETLDEQALRERKASVLKLFEVLNLRPQAGANLSGSKSDEEIHDEAMKNIAKHKPKKVTEIVGDGEEIEVDEGEELTENDIDLIYQKAQRGDKTMGEMEPPDTFTLTLRGYQKQALLWMHSIELGKMDAREASSMHPLWSQYIFPSPQTGGFIDLTAEDKVFYFNAYSGELSLDFPRAERKGRGGILADEMGMGKTIELAALIHTNCEPDTERPADEASSGNKHRQLKLNAAFKKAPRRTSKKPPSATLIVAPTSLLAQWEAEVLRCSKPGTVNVILWHGQNRLDLQDALDDEDGEEEGNRAIKVVVTSYGVLASEHAKARSPVFDVEWLRIVLDEAHSCKSRTSKTAKAVYALHARRRWAVTGTPIVNKLEDLFSLLFITMPFLARDPKAIEIVQIILESILLRREKTMLDTNGKRIVEIDYLEFSSLERRIYNSLFISAKRDFEDLHAKGLVGKNYTHILAMLMRLRRAVLHPNLVLSSNSKSGGSGEDEENDIDVNELIKRFANDASESNVFAKNALENLDVDEQDAECPESELIEVFRPPSSSQDPQPSVVLRKNDFRSSTKLDALALNLRKLRDQDPCFRAVVFSQFTSYLDLIQTVLKREQFEHYRFDGSMDVKARGAALEQFRAPMRKPKVLVVSLKAGGVGLNLTCANHVFMMDCWWNAATENQAIDRVHRIGQEKTVYVKHFIISNTIEGRILQIQKRKTAIVKEAFRGSGSGSSRSDPESIENLKIMFGEGGDDL